MRSADALPLLIETHVFTSSSRLGNPVRVILGPDAASIRQLSHQVRAAWPFALCLAWPVADAAAGSALRVECEQRGQFIRFCGHGLLAVAQLWYELSGAAPTLITHHSRHLTAPPTRDSASVWLYADCPALFEETVSLPLARWLRPAPATYVAAIAGPDAGYRLLELAVDIRLDQLQVEGAAIAAFDRRALLITQPASGQNDYRLRYFAPQYGNAEDAATGSAHVVAASWWHSRLGKRALRGEQCPPAAFAQRGCAQQAAPASFLLAERAPTATPRGPRRPGGVVHSQVANGSVAISGELGPLYRL